MSPSRRILIGLAAGVATGLFLGERATALQWAADGFVKLLQMTVLPYVTLSIVMSLGSLTYAQAATLGRRAGAVLLGLWGLALLYTFLIPLAFPDVQTASFFSTTLLQRRPDFDFVALYIPSNPFNSLANNVVPAVVLFSVVIGVALIGVERKETLLEVLRVAAAAVSRATRLAVRLTPVGLFAIAATTAGTINVEQLGRLQVYLITYSAVALLISLWVLPALIATLTPIRIRELFTLTRDALVTAAVAGDLFIVLPVLIDASKTLLERHSPPASATAELPDVIVPASFNFPHTGKVLSISFILFAGWFADAAVSVAYYPQLAVTGVLTFFGSLNVAVPYLLDLFRVPADTFQLFLATGVVNSRLGTLVAAMHTLTVALLGSCAIGGLLRFDRRRVARYVVTTAALTVIVIGGARAVFAGILRPEYTRGKLLTEMTLLHEPADVTVHRAPQAPEAAPAGPALAAIRERGVVRIGYFADALPYSFFNHRGALVGLDIELAHHLARELGVRVVFVPVEREVFKAELSRDVCDLVMSGVVVTTSRAAMNLFSTPYLDETLALIVADHARERFSHWTEIQAMPSLTIVSADDPYYIAAIRRRLPGADVQIVRDVQSMFGADAARADAIVLPAERGSAWTLLHPEYAVVVPEPGLVKLPLAYPIAGHDEALASFINVWIDLKRKDGTIEALYNHWVLGRTAGPRQPRWSIIRDVLHWVD